VIAATARRPENAVAATARRLHKLFFLTSPLAAALRYLHRYLEPVEELKITHNEKEN
jgi:hypothetical protein